MNTDRKLLKYHARIALRDHHGFFALTTLLLGMANIGLSNLVNYAVPSSGGILNFIFYLLCSMLTNMVYYLLLAGSMITYYRSSMEESVRLADLLKPFSVNPEGIAFYSILPFAMQTAFSYGFMHILRQLIGGTSLTKLFPALGILLLAAAALIWVSLGLSMVFFIYCQTPYLTAGELIKASWDLMRGHRMELFLLDLSFAGLWFFAILSFGFGLFYLKPYITASRLQFYRQLTSQ